MHSTKGKYTKLAALFLCLMFVMCGCGDKLIQLSPDDEDRFASYCALVISKFNSEQKRGVISVDMRDKALSAVLPMDDKTEDMEDPDSMEEEMNGDEEDQGEDGSDSGQSGESTSQDSDSQEGDSASGGGQTPEDAAQEQGYSLNDVLDIPGISFKYKGAGVNDNYGNTDYFVYEPSPGFSFVTVNYTATNETGSPVECDVSSKGVTFSGTMAGEVSSVFRTAFGDDMTTFKGTINPGETKELTILFQFPKNVTNEIENLKLTAIRDGVRYPISS